MTADPYIWITGGDEVRIGYRSITDRLPTVSELAHSLSQINRWTGWGRWPVSVAQHSVIVSYLVSPPIAPHGLMHDGHEPVTGDVSTPMKRHLDSDRLRGAQSRLDLDLAKRLGLRMITKAEAYELKAADLLCCYYEAIHVVGVPPAKADAHFGPLPDGSAAMCERLPATWNHMLHEMPWREARDAFIARWYELTVQTGEAA